jgi:hypothetical protein
MINLLGVVQSNAAVLLPPSPGTNITYGLVGWWPFDETSGASLGDLSGYGNTATTVNSPASVPGTVTNAYSFDGSSQYASVNYSYSFNLTSFTLMCWINTTANGGVILSRNPYNAWEFAINTGTTGSGSFAGQPSFFNGSSWVAAGVPVNNGTWQHVAVVIGAGTTSFYINGQLASSSAQTSPPTDTSDGIFIAQRNGGGGGLNLAASLDDIRIYDRTLSADEISSQFLWRSNAGTLFPVTNAPPVPTANTYYIDYSTGSDANDGTSTGTPWKHHPYMTGFTGAYTHLAGDHFIFKGGVTWPYNCFPLTLQGGGTAIAQDYYGTNVTWFAGSQWSPPIWDDQTPGANSTTGSIDQMPGGKFVNLDWGNYTTIDSIVVTNLTWAGTGNTYGIECGATIGVIITNCQFLCYSNLTGTTGTDTIEIVETSISSLGPNSLNVTHCMFTCLPNTRWSGAAVYYASTLDHCVMHDLPNGFQGVCYTNQYNVIYNLRPSVDPTQHENAIEDWTPANTTSYVHHNIITNCASGELLDVGNNNLGPTDTGTVFIYDNLIANNFGTLTPQIELDAGQQNATKYGSRGTANVFHNTLQDSEPPANCEGFVAIGYRTQDSWAGISQWATVNITNNFVVSEYTAGVVYQITSGATTTINAGFNLLENNATAAANGFTPGNSYKPISANCPTVATGICLARMFSTSGLLYVDMTGKFFPTTSSPDIGAYQFVSGTPVPSSWPAQLHVVSNP